MFELHPARCNISTKMKIHAMNYINNTTTFQEALTSSAKYLMYPSNLSWFSQYRNNLKAFNVRKKCLLSHGTFEFT